MLIFLCFLLTQVRSSNFSVPEVQEVAKEIGTTPDSTFKNSMEVIKVFQEQAKESRLFVKDISQLVLINLLLPILTAILGYIFGKNQEM